MWGCAAVGAAAPPLILNILECRADGFASGTAAAVMMSASWKLGVGAESIATLQSAGASGVDCRTTVSSAGADRFG